MAVFLFTDLESSTRLWEQHPEAMRPALARHDAILRQAVESAGGRVVKTTGDGLMGVFDSAGDAVSAALSAQLDLDAADWGAVGALRVRMGIHGGDAEARDGDYYGTVVNRAARIMAASHGGQVLVSATAAGMLGGPVEGVTLRDLGQHRLKDLTQPEHLLQLVHGGLPEEFPSLITIDATPNNLPTQVSEFLGRESELTAIRRMLQDPSIRLVSLTGPGGTGKTRLALQVGAEEAHRFEGGVFFVDLSGERTSNGAFEAMVRALELTGEGGVPLEILEKGLRDQHLLLVLDNFEQVTDAASGVAGLLERCPRLEVVVTSREVLRVRGEHVFPVPSLALPSPDDPLSTIAASEAVLLFTERAQAVIPDFRVTAENAADIAEICLRLDGLPLAIELAAARLTLFSPRDLRERLRDRIDVLGKGGRDVSDRQRTLTNAIAWSYELLDPSECRVFELMSVFTTARLPALEEVTRAVVAGIEVIEVLGSLVDKSLIRSTAVGGSQRFSMLQTIREFATARLAADPEFGIAARRAHAEYFSRYAQGLRDQLQGAGRAAALEDLAAEIGNLKTAWRHWVDAADLEKLYLLLDGLWALHDARGWYNAVIEITTDMLEVLSHSAPSPERLSEELTLRTSLARALMAVRGYTVEVEQAFTEALALAEQAGGGAQTFPVMRALAAHYMNVAKIPEAAAMGRALVDLAEREHDDAMLAEGLFMVGFTSGLMGDFEQALRLLDRSVELGDAVRGSTRFRLGTFPAVVSRVASAMLRWQSGMLDRAVADVRESLVVARQLDHPISLAYALYHSGYLALDGSRFDETAECAAELAEVSAEHEYRIWGALATVLDGVAAAALGRTAEGLTKTEAGIDLYRGLTAPPVFWPLLLAVRAWAFSMDGRHLRALELIDEALAVSGAQGVPYPDLHSARARALVETGAGAAAEAEYRTAIDIATAMGTRLFELRARRGLVELQRSAGLPVEEDELRRVYDTFTEGFDTPDLVAVRAILGLT